MVIMTEAPHRGQGDARQQPGNEWRGVERGGAADRDCGVGFGERADPCCNPGG